MSEGMSRIVASLVCMLERPFNKHYLMFLCIRRATGDVVKFFIIIIIIIIQWNTSISLFTGYYLLFLTEVFTLKLPLK